MKIRIGSTGEAREVEVLTMLNATGVAGTGAPGGVSSTELTVDQGATEIADTYAGTDSYQTNAIDLELDAAAGTSASDDTAFLAPFMGNVLGNALTKTKNYIGGFIGAYSITGSGSSVLPKAALLGIIMDGSTDATGIVVGHIDGSDPSSSTRAGAVFKATMANAHASSGVDYGLDLHAPAIDIGSQTEVAMPVANADIRMSGQVCILKGSGAPIDGTTGDNFANTGSLYIATTAGKLYINTGAITNPTWVVVGGQT